VLLQGRPIGLPFLVANPAEPRPTVAPGSPWPAALAAALALFVPLAQSVGRRFRRALGNEDIAFWMISQRILPPVAVVIPVYVWSSRSACAIRSSL
jgi:hypothetical protein